MDKPIHVSEIGKLKTVLLKRPGQEVENLTPDIMDRLLFDDIPYLRLLKKSMTTLQRPCKTKASKLFTWKN